MARLTKYYCIHCTKDFLVMNLVGCPLCQAVWNVNSLVVHLLCNWICPFHHKSWISDGIMSQSESHTSFSVSMLSAKVASVILLLYYFFCDLPIHVFWPYAWAADLSLAVCYGSAVVPSERYWVFSSKAAMEKMAGITEAVNKVENLFLARGNGRCVL